MMVTLWWMLLFMTKPNSLIQVITELTFGGHIFVQIALPAITAEMLNSQMDAIKTLLNEYLRNETGEKTKADIVRVTTYMKNRPLNHLVLRFIPIDLRQIISVLSLCTTYFIVIIQFTHIID
ncbi:hypothetical protein O0L34_g16424 [Tuta absoluta]|nr:hypothetical protein O0L34_g16424 [Tuta absoluta]